MPALDGYVCVACERNRHDVCPGCACDSAEHDKPTSAPRRRPAPVARHLSRTERPHNGGPYGARIDPAVRDSIVRDLLARCTCVPGCDRPKLTKQEIAECHGVSYEQVRTVLRNLQTLAGDTRHKDRHKNNRTQRTYEAGEALGCPTCAAGEPHVCPFLLADAMPEPHRTRVLAHLEEVTAE